MKKLSELANEYGGKSINDTKPISKWLLIDSIDNLTEEDNRIISDVAHMLNHLWNDLRHWVIEHINELKNMSEDEKNRYWDEPECESAVIDDWMEMFEINEEDLK